MLFFTARRRWSLLGLSVALLLGTSVAGATAAGGQDLNRFPVEQPQIQILGASSSGVLYRIARHQSGDAVGTWLKPATGAAYPVPASFRNLAGDKIFGSSNTGTTYQLIGTPVTRSCDTAPQPAPPQGFRDVFAPYGWISQQGDRVEAGADGCRVTAKYPPFGAIAAADSLGYVVVRNRPGEDDRIQLLYHSYADPTRPTAIADGGHNRYIGEVALAGTAVSWSQLDYADPSLSASYVVRSSTTGAAPVVTRIDAFVSGTAILGGATGWHGCSHREIPPCTSGSIAADGTRSESVGTKMVASDGSRFIFDTYGASPGVEAATTVGGTAARTRIVTVPLLPPMTYAVALGAGGAAYVDSQEPAARVSRRFYSRSGATLTLTGQTALMPSTPVQVVARDGRRTAMVDAGFNLWLVADDGVRTKVFSAVDKVARVAQYNALQLSGTRLLWWKGKYSGVICDPPAICTDRYDRVVPMLYDLRTGVSTELQLKTPRSLALWGSYLVWSDSTHAIWRRDLSSGRVIPVRAAGAAPVNSVAVHGDHVAWSTCVPGDAGQCLRSTLGYRNLATGAVAVQLVSANTKRVRLSGGHVSYDVYAAGQPSIGMLRVLRLGTRTTSAIAPLLVERRFDVHDETLAWIDPDQVARIGPTAPFPAPPRYLGNALGPAGFTPNGDGVGDKWTPEFSISKALPTCAVTIRSGTTVRRSLPCGSATGSARPSWDGRDSAGKLLPKALYSWTLTGSDADGPLRWWTNATHPIAGTVRIA